MKVFDWSISINYLIISDDSLSPYEHHGDNNSIFQGFMYGIIEMDWAFRILLDLPSDIYDFGLSSTVRIRRRMTGQAWQWLVLNRSSLPQFNPPSHECYWVIITGDKESSKAAMAWAEKTGVSILHISTSNTDPRAIHPEKASWRDIQSYVLACGTSITKRDASFPLASLEDTLSQWRAPAPFSLDLAARTHNCTIPNLLTLKCFGAEFASESQLIGSPGNLDSFIEAIRESAFEVSAMRQRAGSEHPMASRPFKSDLMVVAPAIFAAWRKKIPTKSKEYPEIRDVMEILRQQTGYYFVGEGKRLASLVTPIGNLLMEERSKELHLFTNAIALKAASLVSPVLRLPNSINKTADISQFGDYFRARKNRRSDQKAQKILKRVQDGLHQSIDQRYFTLIEQSSAVKIVSDAPLEWLAVGDLTLGLAKDVSRIPATPGNMVIQELSNKTDLYFKPEAFQEITIISSFEETDRLRDMTADAISLFSSQSKGFLKMRRVFVTSRDELIFAINSCETPLLLFDMHGSHDRNTGIGTLRVGDDNVNFWAMRGKIRPPPIVLLSACDTHSPDRTHVTVGAGLLGCGARTTLATLLPVNGPSAAIFAGRLALRAALYSQAITGNLNRAIDWRNLVSGALRLEFLRELIWSLFEDAGMQIGDSLQTSEKLNMYVHAQMPDWWERSVGSLNSDFGFSIDKIKARAKSVIASKDVIKYVQLGDPESIIITNEEIFKRERMAASQ